MPIGTVISVQNQAIGLGTGSSVDRIIGTKQSGPRGVEAIIEYNGLFLNVRDWIDTYVVTNIDGIDDADVRDSREELPGDHGEAPGQAFYGGRTIVLQGYIETKTMWKMRDMMQALRQAFSNLSQEQPLRFHHPDPTLTIEIFCKKSQKLQIVEEQSTLNYFKRNFSIYLRASNPRFTTRDEVYMTSGIFPGSSYDDILFSLNNYGNFPAQPVFYMTGPFSTLYFENESSHQIFELTTEVPIEQTWIYDSIYRRFYQADTGDLKYGSLSDLSQIVNLDPQPVTNNMHLVATGLTSDSLFEVRYHHTFI